MVDRTTALRQASPARQAHGAYLDARGWALGASTIRLRWRLRRLPRHIADPAEAATRRALSDELTDRGATTS